MLPKGYCIQYLKDKYIENTDHEAININSILNDFGKEKFVKNLKTTEVKHTLNILYNFVKGNSLTKCVHL